MDDRKSIWFLFETILCAHKIINRPQSDTHSVLNYIKMITYTHTHTPHDMHTDLSLKILSIGIIMTELRPDFSSESSSALTRGKMLSKVESKFGELQTIDIGE